MGEPFGKQRVASANDVNAILASWFSGPEDCSAGTATAEHSLVQRAGLLSTRPQPEIVSAGVPALPRMAAPLEPLVTVGSAADKTTTKPDLSTTLTDFRLESTPSERAQTRLSAYDRVQQIRFSPDSPSYRWLSNNGLLSEFQQNMHSEQQTWLADGRFSVVLKTGNGYGQTIVLNCDGTNSQRITGPDGRVLAQFTSTGKVIEPNRNTSERAVTV